MPENLCASFDEALSEQRERATQRLAALGEMTGGIAHDFRNLLAVIDSGIRLIESSANDPEKVRSYLSATREGIDRGVELTSQLLNFAKHQVLNAHKGDINEFLRVFEPFLRYGAGSKIRVRLELGSDLPACLIDPAFFDAAILNLVVNARDATPNGGEIRIITDRWEPNIITNGAPQPGVYARVSVEDDGVGMSEQVLRSVFDPLFSTKGEGGTALVWRKYRRLRGWLAGMSTSLVKKALEPRLRFCFHRANMSQGDFPCKPGFYREF